MGFITPKVGMAEVGVDLPEQWELVEAVLLFKVWLLFTVWLLFKSSGMAALLGGTEAPLSGSLTGSFGEDSVCKKATNA